MKLKLMFIFSVLIILGCANTSGVVPLGGGSYLISRSEKGFDVTGSAVKADAIKEANEYCSLKNKSLELIKTNQKDMVPFKSDAQAEIEFKCI
ncbi:hypothetical protein [Teredinibacter haidensis]|uniref:hypothetical protein n=1 Tax=Teredinibacter haidensis TaxID=2731755 RepID=UPI000948D8C2|nr:hypothetical protein [Teredinibacter haidensis]